MLGMEPTPWPEFGALAHPLPKAGWPVHPDFLLQSLHPPNPPSDTPREQGGEVHHREPLWEWDLISKEQIGLQRQTGASWAPRSLSATQCKKRSWQTEDAGLVKPPLEQIRRD